MPDRTGDIPACAICSRPAVFFRRDTRRYLCADHLVSDVEERVRTALMEQYRIRPDDRIAVAFSGGKDSSALLAILSRVIPDIPLVAVTVDEGIAGYRAETLRAATVLAGELHIPHHVVSFPDKFGGTLDQFLKGREKEACTVCGILRKKAIMDAAKACGATRIATGHNLDDEAQSVLMNVLRGDLARLARDSGAESAGGFIPRIKPLAAIPEQEVAAYLFCRGMFPVLPECPYTHHALRAEARSLLSALERGSPGTMVHLIKSRDRVAGMCRDMPHGESLKTCRVCGDPCSGDLCQACELARSLAK